MPGKAFSNQTRRLLLVLAATTVVVVVAAAFFLRGGASSVPAKPRVDESDIADFVGNEACQPCHAALFAQHRASSHAHTLRLMNRAELGAQAPTPGRINNSQYALVERDNQFFFEVNPPQMPDKYQLWPLDYVFGSGKVGISFVNMLEGRNVVEMKMSYFPPEKVWRVTPGQQLDNPAAAGNMGNLEQSRRCLSCHIIAMSKNTFAPRREMFNVGCESCHGPGRSHIAAVHSGERDLKMARLAQMGARDLNTLCGKCHQTEKDVTASPMLSKMTFRFQPYGLMKSRCFWESGDRLSCRNCHNAHQDVVKGAESYTGACLSCHSAPTTVVSAPTLSRGTSGKVCPVNPKSGCVNCHMPKRDVLSATNQTTGLTMTEHLIAIYPDAGKPGTSPPASPH